MQLAPRRHMHALITCNEVWPQGDLSLHLTLVEGVLEELLEKKKRLRQLLRTDKAEEMLEFFRENGVMHESGRAIQKLLVQKGLWDGTSTMLQSGWACLAPM
jgi:hypothetical protein